MNFKTDREIFKLLRQGLKGMNLTERGYGFYRSLALFLGALAGYKHLKWVVDSEQPEEGWLATSRR
jgi:hypothetical protein